MYNTETINALTPTSWFCNLCFHSQNENDTSLPSILEIVFPLDSGAFVSVINKPNYKMITQLFDVCDHHQRDTSKRLTIANQSEVPSKQYISVTCFSSIETESRNFFIPFVVADIKVNTPWTPFIKKCIQSINIKDFFMTFKHCFNDQPSIASFTTLVEENFLFFSFNCQKKSKGLTYFKINSVKTLPFLIKNSKTFSPNTENHDLFFVEMPQTHFLSKLNRYFSFMEISSNNSEHSGSVIIENTIMHIALLRSGIAG